MVNMKKTLLLLSIVILSFTARPMCKIIDDFNSDGSTADEANVVDALWTFPTDFTGIVDSAISYDGTKNLQVTFRKNYTWAYFLAADLWNIPNVHNFADYKTISADVYGKVTLMIKFGRFVYDNSKQAWVIQETADGPAVKATEEKGWTHVEWDISELNWQSVDKSRVEFIYFFPDPGEITSKTIRIDNLAVGPDPDPYTQKNLLLDNFNYGSDTNKLGGYGTIWPDSVKDRCIRKYYFDGDPSQVHGRTGRSLQFWWGDNNAGMPVYSGYMGWFASLNKKNLSKYGAVSFWINGTSGGETFEFGLKDTNDVEKKVSINNYIQYETGDTRSGMVKNAWRKVLIPFSAFAGIDFTRMDNYSITLAPETYGMFFLDDILFHSFSWINLQNFEGGSIGSGNSFGGGQGSLGKGTFEIETTNKNNGSYAGKVFSGGDGLVDDFEHVPDQNYWGQRNQDQWTNPPNVTTASYTTAEYYQGAKSLKVDFTSGMYSASSSGLILHLGKHFVEGYDYLTFWVKGSADGIKFKVGLKDGAGTEVKLDVGNYISGGANTSWQEVKIKLSDFIAADAAFFSGGKSVDYLVLEFSYANDSTHTSGSVYIDNLQFGRNGAWLSLNSADVSKYDSLIFYLKGASGGEVVSVRMQDTVGNGHDSIEVDVTATASWARQKISLSQFTGISLSKAGAIHFSMYPSSKTVYIDDIQLGDAGASTTPTAPYNLKANGEGIAVGAKFGPRTLMSANADSYVTDMSMEGVRFEYSLDGSVWNTMNVDYDTDNNEYAVGWNATSLIGQSCMVRAVAQNVMGKDSLSNMTVSGIEVESQDVFVYPNPFYPNKGSKKINFVNIVTEGILKIYTISGELVITLKDDGMNSDSHENDGMITWDGKNTDGSLLASGIYLFMLTQDKGRVSSGKFVVIK